MEVDDGIALLCFDVALSLFVLFDDMRLFDVLLFDVLMFNLWLSVDANL